MPNSLLVVETTSPPTAKIKVNSEFEDRSLRVTNNQSSPAGREDLLERLEDGSLVANAKHLLLHGLGTDGVVPLDHGGLQRLKDPSR